MPWPTDVRFRDARFGLDSRPRGRGCVSIYVKDMNWLLEEDVEVIQGRCRCYRGSGSSLRLARPSIQHELCRRCLGIHCMTSGHSKRSIPQSSDSSGPSWLSSEVDARSCAVSILVVLVGRSSSFVVNWTVVELARFRFLSMSRSLHDNQFTQLDSMAYR